eukprot:RCo020673
MGHKYTRLLPVAGDPVPGGLVIGPLDFLVQPTVLSELQVGAVVCCLARAPPTLAGVLAGQGIDCSEHGSGEGLMAYPLEDSSDNYVSLLTAGPGIEQVTAFIHRHREAGRTVLVHCDAGFTRSAAVAAAYLMRYRYFPSRRQCLEFLRTRRPSVDITLFYDDLVALERGGGAVPFGDPVSVAPPLPLPSLPSTPTTPPSPTPAPSFFSSTNSSTTFSTPALRISPPARRHTLSSLRDSSPPPTASSFPPTSSTAASAALAARHTSLQPPQTPPLAPSSASSAKSARFPSIRITAPQAGNLGAGLFSCGESSPGNSRKTSNCSVLSEAQAAGVSPSLGLRSGVGGCLSGERCLPQPRASSLEPEEALAAAAASAGFGSSSRAGSRRSSVDPGTTPLGLRASPLDEDRASFMDYRTKS